MHPTMMHIINDEFDTKDIVVVSAKPDKVVLKVKGEEMRFEDTDAGEFYGWAGSRGFDFTVDEGWQDSEGEDDTEWIDPEDKPFKDSDNPKKENWGKDDDDDMPYKDPLDFFNA